MHILKFTKKFTKKNAILLVAVSAIVFVASPAVLYFVAGVDILGFIGHKETDIGKWGTVGDYFGGILNPILSFLGLYLLLQTIKIQSKELELSRIELEKSVKMQEEQGQMLEAQERQMALQTFDNTFFQLLNLYHRNMDFWNSISFQDVYNFHLLEVSKLICEDKELELYFQKINVIFESEQTGINIRDICNVLTYKKPTSQESFFNFILEYKTDKSDAIKRDKSVFFDMYLEIRKKQMDGEFLSKFHENLIYKQKYRNEKTRLLNIYLKSVFSILEFIDNHNFNMSSKLDDISEVNRKDESHYIRIFKTQISEFQLVLIFYGAYTSSLLGEPRFKMLIEKYTLFENFPENLLLIKDHAKFYNSSAYSS